MSVAESSWVPGPSALGCGSFCPPRDSVAVFPRSLQGGGMYQEGPGHDPAALPTVCPGPGLCPLAISSNKLGPRSWPSLALAPSKEVSFPTGQLGHSPGLDFMMHPGDAAMAVSIATLAEPSPTGGFTPVDAEVPHWVCEVTGGGRARTSRWNPGVCSDPEPGHQDRGFPHRHPR